MYKLKIKEFKVNAGYSDLENGKYKIKQYINVIKRRTFRVDRTSFIV